MSDYEPTREQEKAIREYLHESIVPLIEQVLVKKLGQAMSFAAEQLIQPKPASKPAIKQDLTPEQPAQQEPVAVVSGYYGGQCVVVPTNPARIFNSGTAFYTSQPPRKPWVGLTQQDINIAFDDTQEGGGFDDFARAIETKLREKNAPQQSKEDA